MRRRRRALLILVVILAMIVPAAATGQEPAAPDGDVVEATLMHTNDFHGRLETDYRGRGGAAYVADLVNDVRAAVGEDSVALIDAGDEFFAAPAICRTVLAPSIFRTTVHSDGVRVMLAAGAASTKVGVALTEGTV